MLDETRYSVRPHKTSDMDWVVEAQREIPSSEFGFNQDFAQMVQGIVTEFVKCLDEKRGRCWIAEMAGEPVGGVFLVKRVD